MIDAFHVKNPLYPLISISASFLIFLGSLLMARSPFGPIFLAAVYISFFFFGYWKSCLKILPFFIIYQTIFSVIFYFSSGRNLEFVIQMAVRLGGLVIAVIPGLSLPPVNLVRNLSDLHCPRLVTLGMLITLSFIPVLNSEINQIKNAMKTRGATSFWKPQVIYRAFLIPLIVRLVNISDTLTLSVETRAFICPDIKATNYKSIKIKGSDIIFSLIFIVIFAGCLLAGLVIK
ncbi:MAG: energy-coupling factor transporter transmembrane protein EcfT [Treponema sp.]|nr:energy-coupling factor transporter transmembrane protein EcfT [Treponema sp.]